MAIKENGEASSVQFPVVGIGASAGGLEALKTFLKALPAKTGMAYVFVQHLSPNHESILPVILEKVAPFPVQQITDNVHLEQDHLYIIPENKMLTATDGVLKLAPLDPSHKKGNTIDLFFSSLGHVHQSYAIGVVLSGALTDGTIGLQVIKSFGGLTFAQDSSAAFDSMPANAVKSGAVDFVLSPDKIAQRLIASNYPFHTDYSTAEIAETLQQHDEEVFKQILTVLRVRRGVDFSYYKKNTLKRRIIRRMALIKIERPAEYIIFLRENKGEQDALYNDMLISVTNFFRDPKSFELVCGTLLPSLISKKNSNDSLRIWIAGCATGEEAYSMAICLQEQLGDKAAAMKIQIFATDISEIAIAKARTGIYRQNELEGLSSSRIQQFFIKLDGSYQVNKIIRDMCVFAHHNLLKDPPFSKIDVVSCRNVMIYLEPVLQKRALSTFHYSLVEDGFLMLGKSETIGINTDIFTAYNNSEKIYRRKGPVGRFMTVSSPAKEQSFRDIDQSSQKDGITKDVYKLADEAILANCMPPSVLVNEKFDIIQFRGTTELWLIPPSGKPSFNILKMAREGLAFEVRNLLHLAHRSKLPARKFGVFFKVNGLQHYVNLQAIPLKDSAEPYFLVVFQTASSTGINKRPDENRNSPENENYNESELHVEQLEKELTQARADMRTITEEQETANEELQSANEELLSGSEELQSLNEELETSKEELQSTNEEVMIVNKELIDRNDQLNNARLYAEGIVSTIRDPLLVLDKDMRVKRATSGFYNKFNTTEKQTEDHYIYEIGDQQWNIPKLKELLEEILPAKKELEDFEINQSFAGIGNRIMLLNARQMDNFNGEKLILLAIEDITDKRKIEKAEHLLTESKERLESAIDSAGLGTWDYNLQTKELLLDKRCREILNLPLTGNADPSFFYQTLEPDNKELVKNIIQQSVANGNSGKFDTEFSTASIDEKIKWLKARGKVYFDEQGIAIRFVGTLMDITLEKMLKEATHELLRKKDEFISIASHELRSPITSLKAALQMIERTTAHNGETQQVRGYVDRALKQVDKLITLISDLLDVSKIQAGKLELRKTKFLLDDLVKECCEEVQSGTGKRRVNIEGEKEIMVYADRNRLEQVIINLLSNAIKYSPNQEHIVITISKTANETKISVMDHGIGVPKNKIPYLFDRFYQVEGTLQKHSGLGLGRFISAEIIKRHNGEIHIDSDEGKGSVFWFTIPDDKE